MTNLQDVFYELQDVHNNPITSGSVKIDINEPIDELKRAVYNANDTSLPSNCRYTNLHVYAAGTTDYTAKPASAKTRIRQLLSAMQPDDFVILVLHPPLPSSSSSITTQSPTSDVTQQILQRLDELNKQQQHITKLTSLVVEQNLDPWEGSTERTKVVADQLTADVLKFYDYRRHECMVIGNIGKKTKRNFVKTAHIWPHHTHGQGLPVLQLSAHNVNSVRNCLRLHHAVERAFDQKWLTVEIVSSASSSIPSTLKILVLNPDIMKQHIGTTTHTFGNINGRNVVFNNNNRPYHRLLGLHYRNTIVHARKMGWIAFEDLTAHQIHYLELVKHTMKNVPIESMNNLSMFALT